MWYPARSVSAEPSVFTEGAVQDSVAVPLVAPEPEPDPDPEPDPPLEDPVLEPADEPEPEPELPVDDDDAAAADDADVGAEPPPQPASTSATMASPQTAVSDFINASHRTMPAIEPLGTRRRANDPKSRGAVQTSKVHATGIFLPNTQ